MLVFRDWLFAFPVQGLMTNIELGYHLSFTRATATPLTSLILFLPIFGDHWMHGKTVSVYCDRDATQSTFCLAFCRRRSVHGHPNTTQEIQMKPEQSVTAQLAALPQMPMPELWKLWDAHFARRPGTWNRHYVASRVAHKIQEAAFGGINPNIRQRLLRMGESQSVFGNRREGEVHLMPGTVLMRDWAEATHRVVVTPEGFYDLGGKVFKSLSAVARHITGTQWSGPRFFGVGQAKSAAGAQR